MTTGEYPLLYVLPFVLLMMLSGGLTLRSSRVGDTVGYPLLYVLLIHFAQVGLFGFYLSLGCLSLS